MVPRFLVAGLTHTYRIHPVPSIPSSLSTPLKAALQLGIRSTFWFALYQFGLKGGHYRRESRRRLAQSPLDPTFYRLAPVLDLPCQESLERVLGQDGKRSLLEEVEEILGGKVRLFGSSPVPLDLGSGADPRHWSQVSPPEGVDIKLIWEPARFGFVFPLGRWYSLSGDERCPQAFWRTFEEFERLHPPETGLNWSSAQEVALRSLAYTFASQVFSASPHTTPNRLISLGRSIAACADRIPSTLPYARAQGNNHLLVEAVALFNAGTALPNHPKSRAWRQRGLRIFQAGILDQIEPDGTYVQQSTNYHRLMLNAALWAHTVMLKQSLTLEPQVLDRLSAAVRWLLALVDPLNGSVPNLGPNDGANILPLSACPFADYRPTLQAASLAFLGKPAFPHGPWDEQSLWFGQVGLAGDNESGAGAVGERDGSLTPYPSPRVPCQTTPHILDNPAANSRAYFRIARFRARPGHADQLHFDLWQRGVNLALDPGTYLYNAAPPWDNALSSAFYHNTLTVDGREPMLRAGKFLWLDWSQAEVEDCRRDAAGGLVSLTARQDGYRKLGVIHRRQVTAVEAGWSVEDDLLPATSPIPLGKHTARLHWLMPDFPWQLEQPPSPASIRLMLHTPNGLAYLEISSPTAPLSFVLVRAGDLIAGEGNASPAAGWYSPTYGVRLAALSLLITASGEIPLKLVSRWALPVVES